MMLVLSSRTRLIGAYGNEYLPTGTNVLTRNCDAVSSFTRSFSLKRFFLLGGGEWEGMGIMNANNINSYPCQSLFGINWSGCVSLSLSLFQWISLLEARFIARFSSPGSSILSLSISQHQLALPRLYLVLYSELIAMYFSLASFTFSYWTPSF